MKVSDESGNGCLLTTCSYTVAAIHGRGTYLLFDSHSRDMSGLPTSDGKAVLMKFNDPHSMARHIRRLYRSSLHAQFDVVVFQVSLVENTRNCASQNKPQPSSHNANAKEVRMKLPNGRTLIVSVQFQMTGNISETSDS